MINVSLDPNEHCSYYVMGYSYCSSETEYKYSQSVTISMCWLDKPPVLIKKEGNKSCFYNLWSNSSSARFLLVNIAPFMALKFCSIESMSSRSYTITSLIVKRSPPQSPADPIARDWRGGGGGGTKQMFIREGSAPRSNPLPFYIQFFTKRYSFRIASIEKWYPFHIPCLELCIPFNCCKCTVF